VSDERPGGGGVKEGGVIGDRHRRAVFIRERERPHEPPNQAV
jgi:hypothetical protein